tara:strand:- start:1521 stop:2231 length:711 start_codon:yes stop_codon:yes gene_type:complete
MKVHIITPFPEMVESIINCSILAKSQQKGYVEYYTYNLFDFAENSTNNRIDDYPFGGGAGMILKPEPIFEIFGSIKKGLNENSKIIYPTPDGQLLNHNLSKELSHLDDLVIINGHYKGIDQRIRDHIITDEISIGDYVLTGGELAGMIILDSVVRLMPGVINSKESSDLDSFSHPLLDGPHYTRPARYKDIDVPEILLSGNHKEIEKWFNKKREEKTKLRRPDLWDEYKRLKKSKE